MSNDNQRQACQKWQVVGQFFSPKINSFCRTDLGQYTAHTLATADATTGTTGHSRRSTRSADMPQSSARHSPPNPYDQKDWNMIEWSLPSIVCCAFFLFCVKQPRHFHRFVPRSPIVPCQSRRSLSSLEIRLCRPLDPNDATQASKSIIIIIGVLYVAK